MKLSCLTNQKQFRLQNHRDDLNFQKFEIIFNRMIRIGVPKEIHPDERRVAATPQTILRLCKLGFEG